MSRKPKIAYLPSQQDVVMEGSQYPAPESAFSARPRYPLDQLKPNESFSYPAISNGGGTIAKQMAAIRSAINHYVAKNPGQNFVATHDALSNRVRVWRLPDSKKPKGK